MSYTIFDAHCDTIQKVCDTNQSLRENNLHLSLKKMRENQHIQIFAAFIDKKNDHKPPFARCNQLIDCYFDEISQNQDLVSHCLSTADIYSALREKKTAALLSVEGGEALEGRLENLDFLYNRGVRLITLSWNYKNEICRGVEEDDGEGLTEFGKLVIARMNELGMVVDVSHISEKSFWDTLEYSKKPIVASHSNIYALKGHKRNLNDRQIKAIILNDGCIGINLYEEFLSNAPCKLSKVIEHIEYVLALGGENNTGIGSDFDGIDKMPEGITGIQDLLAIPEELLRLGYSEDLVKKITHKNFLRLFDNVFE